MTVGKGLASAGVPALPRGALAGLALVLLMTYLAMPFATRALKRWLYPSPPP